MRLEERETRLPDHVPRLSDGLYRLFRPLWLLLFILAAVGPIGGIIVHLAEPPRNSELVLGSRAGVAVPEADAATIRYAVGSKTRDAGLKSGDKILAIDDTRLPQPMPLSDEALDANNGNPAYRLVNDTFFGTVPRNRRLTVLDGSGEVRTLVVQTGETHIDEDARLIGLSPSAMGLIHLVHVIFYPILLWVAFVLHLRNPREPVPTLLSVSILLITLAEQPSGSLLLHQGVPRSVLVALFDAGNMAFLASILLFPDARLRPRAILLPLCALLILPFLHGQAYQLAFMIASLLALTLLGRRLRVATGAKRQQLKLLWAGLLAYPAFRGLSVLLDLVKMQTGGLRQQIMLEAGEGVTFALVFTSLILVLFSAVRRHRLYDAEALFSRSVMVAAVTLGVTIFFAVTSATLENTTQTLLGRNAGIWPTLMAAAAAALLLRPAQKRLHSWSELRFRRELFELRRELPKRMDDLRETTPPREILKHALDSISAALRTTTAAALIDGKVSATIGAEGKQVREWAQTHVFAACAKLECDRRDELFPVRLALKLNSGPAVAWILLGPRPDGSLYSKDERDTLMEVSEPIARAVLVARERHNSLAADRRWKSRLDARLRVVEEHLFKPLLSKPRRR